MELKDVVARYLWSGCREMCWNALLTKRKRGEISKDTWNEFYDLVSWLYDDHGYIRDREDMVVFRNNELYKMEPAVLLSELRIRLLQNELEALNDD